MPVSCASMVQNCGVFATDLAPPAPNPVTSSQPLARTITGRNCRRPDMNSSTYPPPTSMGQNNAECGIAGSLQTALARVRAAAGSRTVTPGLCAGIGLAWPSSLRDGVRTTRTRVTAAGSAHSSAESDWRGGPGVPPGPFPGPPPAPSPPPARPGVGVLAGELVRDVGDPLAQRLRIDALLKVKSDLLGAAPVRLVDRLAHRRRDLVGVHVHLTVDVTGRPADGLDQRRARAQESFLVRVEDRDQRDLG